MSNPISENTPWARIAEILHLRFAPIHQLARIGKSGYCSRNREANMDPLHGLIAALLSGQLAELVCRQMDETDMGDREGYARHLCLCACSCVHAWAHAEISRGSPTS